ncbi:class F sortase [Guptibacillus algicola]|uniref:class F sortase n=1 Tax=Guptibacillus algicola TaxID=225844 RepID=UPI001CD6E2F0|nr:class F sortase [Alkalihalobacillus algicola]MCA0989394.1 class F sortase [Alkalihalobacillus algicola]
MSVKKILTIILLGAAMGCSSSNLIESETLTGSDNTEEVVTAFENSTETNNTNDQLSNEGIVPAQLVIQEIGVDAKVEHVGQLPNGQMDVPTEDKNVGWYELGAEPGEAGNAVIAGHVDNKTGPAVFFHLGDLKPGDVLTVTSDKGKSYEFTVESIASYPRNNAPLEKIFGMSNKPRLNLITCSGGFNRNAGTHEERMVVYTVLTSN